MFVIEYEIFETAPCSGLEDFINFHSLLLCKEIVLEKCTKLIRKDLRGSLFLIKLQSVDLQID